MKKSSDFKYILLPLPVIQEVFKKPKTGINKMFSVGIYRVAQTLDIDNGNALRQLIYYYFRHPGELPRPLYLKINGLVNDETLPFYDDYSGFDGYGDFNPEEEVIALEKYVKTDVLLLDQIKEFYRLRQVKTVLNMRFGMDHIIKDYKELQSAYNGFTGVPLISLKTDLMFEYLNKEKSDFQKTVFAMYAGIRSVLGNKDFVGTTREMIICRMFGAVNKEKLKPILKDKKVKAAYDKYSTRHQFEKLLNYLLSHKFISAKIGYKRRTYLSCTLSYQDLAIRIQEHLENSLNSGNNSHKQKELQAKNYLNQHLNK